MTINYFSKISQITQVSKKNLDDLASEYFATSIPENVSTNCQLKYGFEV